MLIHQQSLGHRYTDKNMVKMSTKKETMINKIHKNLLKEVKVLSDNEYDCLVSSCDFLKTKQLLNDRKIQYTAYPFISNFYIKTNYANILNLSEENDVSFLSSPTKVSTQILNAKSTINFDKLTNGKLYGQGVTICFIDTGIYPHIDFMIPKCRIKRFVDLTKSSQSMYDDNGHGTFVASVCCSSGKRKGGKYSGIAPLADIVMIKALDKNGETNSNKILEAMQYVFDHAKELDIKVVCMSFGADSIGKNDPLQKGANALWDKGIAVVVAAGNSGPNNATIKSPGASEKVITVGGLDSTDQKHLAVAEFSSRGPVKEKFKPDLIAPSVNIIGANISSNEPYIKLSGTSVATPIVTGVCAVILEQHPDWSPNQIKYYLVNHCTHLSYDKNSEGFGYLQF